MGIPQQLYITEWDFEPWISDAPDGAGLIEIHGRFLDRYVWRDFKATLERIVTLWNGAPQDVPLDVLVHGMHTAAQVYRDQFPNGDMFSTGATHE